MRMYPLPAARPSRPDLCHRSWAHRGSSVYPMDGLRRTTRLPDAPVPPAGVSKLLVAAHWEDAPLGDNVPVRRVPTTDARCDRGAATALQVVTIAGLPLRRPFPAQLSDRVCGRRAFSIGERRRLRPRRACADKKPDEECDARLHQRCRTRDSDVLMAESPHDVSSGTAQHKSRRQKPTLETERRALVVGLTPVRLSV